MILLKLFAVLLFLYFLHYQLFIRRSSPWTICTPSSVEQKVFLYLLSHSLAYPLDRWNCSRCNHINCSFNNYLGFGVDANILLQFHTLRQRYPFLFISQPVNILLYALCIIKEHFIPTTPQLTHLELSIDGKKVDCSNYLSVVCLNIPCFCGGGHPIGKHLGYRQCCDEEIEVIAFTSVLHVMKVKV